MFALVGQTADIRVGYFQTLGDELLYIFLNYQELKVAPSFLRPALKGQDSRSFSSLCEIAITQLLPTRKQLTVAGPFAAADCSGTCGSGFSSMAQSFPDINGLRHIITIKQVTFAKIYKQF